MINGQKAITKATTFLLVEDEPNDVFFVRRQFSHGPQNLRLFAVNDGAEAIRYVEGQGEYGDRSTHPLPDVILLDLKMPRINGFEFLEWLRGKAPDKLRLIPVIIMSSSSLAEDIQRAYELGANSYIVKPVNWDEFKDRLRALSIYWVEHVEKP
jgi:CheY-like chemotaxis protein